MPNQPFVILESLFSLESARPELVRLGRQVVAQDERYRAYAQRQCALADRALQGDYSVSAILLLDRTRITSPEQLWQYRQFMALISDYKPQQKKDAWIEAEEADERLANDFRRGAPEHISIAGIAIKPREHASPLELCLSIRFGYPGRSPELVSVIKKILMQDREGAAEILKAEYERSARTNRAYAAFLQQWYAELLHKKSQPF